MAKKIILETFTGVTPRLPNHALPEAAASSAINARLSDNTIRPFYKPAVSGDLAADLSVNFAGYTNFFKASKDTTLAWMSWTADVKVSTLEVRYNDIDAYDYPTAPELTPEGGDLSVVLAGVSPTTVVLVDDNSYASIYTFTHTSAYAPDVATIPLTNLTMQVTTTLEFTLDTIVSYSWVYVSGDVEIVVDNPAIANPTFTCPVLNAPTTIDSVEDVSAVWEVSVADASGNSGTRKLAVNFNYAWTAPEIIYTDNGGGGGGAENEDRYFKDLF